MSTANNFELHLYVDTIILWRQQKIGTDGLCGYKKEFQYEWRFRSLKIVPDHICEGLEV